MAIRLYLESFRLPGEAQKINRVMESFGKHYHAQCPDLFRNADAVYILGYSVILLNTDQHNVGVGRLTLKALACLGLARLHCRGEWMPAASRHLLIPCRSWHVNPGQKNHN